MWKLLTLEETRQSALAGKRQGADDDLEADVDSYGELVGDSFDLGGCQIFKHGLATIQNIHRIKAKIRTDPRRVCQRFESRAPLGLGVGPGEE